jgi:hypothetical protein
LFRVARRFNAGNVPVRLLPKHRLQLLSKQRNLLRGRLPDAVVIDLVISIEDVIAGVHHGG